MIGSVSITLGNTPGIIAYSDSLSHTKMTADGKLQITDKTATQKISQKDDQLKRVEDLKRIDSLVRSHESAHAAAAGGLAQGASFNMTTGPDGKQYATGGEVRIDIAPVSGNPRATIAKMQIVRRAALAPTDPSGQDRAVAATASAIEAQARTKITETSLPRQVKHRMPSAEQSPLISAAYRKPQITAQSSFSTII